MHKNGINRGHLWKDALPRKQHVDESPHEQKESGGMNLRFESLKGLIFGHMSYDLLKNAYLEIRKRRYYDETNKEIWHLQMWFESRFVFPF